MARRLVLIRHGQVGGRHAGRYLGSTDAALSPAGLRQARGLAPYLRALRPAACFSSPLRRCTGTARAALAALPLVPELVLELREADFGAWEGLSFAEIAARDAEAAGRFARLEPGFRFPGGESLAEFASRVGAAAGRMAAAPAETVVAFTHGGVMRFMLCALLRLPAAAHGAFALPPAAVAELALCEGAAVLEFLGDPRGAAAAREARA